MLEETWSKKQQDRSSGWLLLFTFNIISYSYSSPAEYYRYYLLWTLLYSYSYGSQVKIQQSSGHISYLPRKLVREKRLSFRGHGDFYLIVLKAVACLASWCRENTFPSPSNVWWHRRHSRSQRSHGPSDIFYNCTWVCMGLDGSTRSECLPVVTCDFEPPEHVPRTSARVHTGAVVFGRAPSVPRSREHEKRPAGGGEKKCRSAKKKRMCRVIQDSPSGCVRHEIPGMTQVDEKGHEANTAVVTAYICWRKHGIYLAWGINSD